MRGACWFSLAFISGARCLHLNSAKVADSTINPELQHDENNSTNDENTSVLIVPTLRISTAKNTLNANSVRATQISQR